MIIELIIFTLFAACAAVFLHYCIGSPVQGEFYSGRIFSAYGRFISAKYLEWEQQESNRIWRDYSEWKQLRDERLERDLYGKNAHDSELLYEEYLEQVDLVYNNTENKMRANPYSMLGACPICFSTWVSLFCFIFFIIFVPFPVWYIFIGTPAAVIISRYIKIA